MATKNLLQNIYLFKKMQGEELDVISQAVQNRTYSPTEEIFAQGEKAKAMYFIKYGSVRIHQKSTSGDSIEVATLGTGSHFGEMGFVDQEPRSASATAIEKSDILVFDYDQLQKVLMDHPRVAVKLYRELAHFLCGRLRITTNDLSFARERNLSHF
jgi:CRP-like cAMP-binding protein